MNKQQYLYSVDSNRFYNEILEWLQVNVGNVLWSQPIVAWHGDGWHMSQGVTKFGPRLLISKSFYTVAFEDKEKALMFGLWT